MTSHRLQKILRAIALAALAALLLAPVAPAQSEVQGPQSGKSSRPLPSKDELTPFPYELVNYTQAAHEQRIMNAPVIVVGRIDSFHEIKSTEKALNWAVWLKVETFLRTDRPGQENAERLFFRCLPLMESFKKPIAVGDRCVVLLDRDLRIDNALILTTDTHYYGVSTEGQLRKFVKTAPTQDDPVLQEQSVSSFLEEIRRLLRSSSLEQQALSSDLVMIGTVTDSRQGVDNASDYMYVQFKPEKVFKGDPSEGSVTFIQRANPYRWTVSALNRAAFRKGERVLCFGNRDPTFSKPGIWNPTGETLHVFPLQRLSSLFVATDTAWRRGFRPIPLKQLYEDLARWTGSESAEN